MRKYRQLTKTDRMKIEALYNAGFNGLQISKELGFHHSTIYRELRKGKTTKLYKGGGFEKTIYSADLGQIVRDDNQAKCRKDKYIKGDSEFIEYFEYMVIHWHYSPQAILYDIEENGLEFRTKVCLTTLYNYIKAGEFKNIKLDYLPYSRRKDRKKRKVQKRLPRGKSIEERPEEIENRSEFGHWEMDSVVGKRQNSGKAFLVLTERKTRSEIIMLVKDHSSGEVVRSLDKLERKFGEKDFRNIFKSITVDNGMEFQDYKGMMRSRRNKTLPRTQIYYCHAYRSCERGSNETQNRFIRRWIPKGTSLNKFTQGDCNKIARWINEYPRKMFDGKSSLFMIRQEVNWGHGF